MIAIYEMTLEVPSVAAPVKRLFVGRPTVEEAAATFDRAPVIGREILAEAVRECWETGEHKCLGTVVATLTLARLQAHMTVDGQLAPS